MKKTAFAILASLLFVAAACSEEAICFHNCPDETGLICDQVDMEPGQQGKCQELANQKCEENPDKLDAFNGDVLFKLVTCSGNENCGLPEFCLSNYLHQ